MQRRSPSESRGVLFVLGGISAITAASIDIIMPANAHIAREMGVDEGLGALLIGAYFMTYAVGQLLWGLVSDAYGRRPVALTLLALFVASSVGCAAATDFYWLVAFRALQGFFGAVTVVAQAVVRDSEEGAASARLLAALAAINSIAPVVAPIIGSALLVVSSWRSSFVALAIFGAVLGVLAFFTLPETTPGRRPERLSLRFVLSGGRFLFAQRGFVVGVGAMAMIFGGYSAVLSAGALVTETAYGVSPEVFGLLFALAALSVTGGITLTRALLARVSLAAMDGIAAAFVAAALLAQLAVVFATPSLVVFWAAVCVYTLVFGVLIPFLQGKALDPAGEMPGFAASLIGSLMMAAGAVGASVSTLLHDGTHRAVSLTMCVFAALALAVLAGNLIASRRL